MAEDALGDKRVYDPTQDKAPTTTRRGFLKGLGIITAGILGGKIIGDRVIAQPETVSTELEYKPTKILEGDLEIIKQINLRSKPNLDEPNITPWTSVKKVNGIDVSGTNSFRIKNIPTVEGQNPDGDQNVKSPWGQIKIEQHNGSVNEAFFSISSQTASAVKRDFANSRYVDIAEIRTDGYILKDGRQLTSQQIGVVTVPQNK